MENIKQQFILSENLADQKIPLLQQNFDSQTLETPMTFLEETLKLLGQNLENKLNWDEKLLFTNDSSEEQVSLGKNTQNTPNESANFFLASQSYTMDAQNWKKVRELWENENQIKVITISEVEEENEESEKSQKITEKKIIQGCSCKKTSCLRLYCQCFKSGKKCEDCACIGCKNQGESEQERKKAVKEVKEKKPFAFEETLKYNGCHCTKSQCVKGYCQCYLAGYTCGKYCKCVACLNRACSKTRKGSDNTTIEDI